MEKRYGCILSDLFFFSICYIKEENEDQDIFARLMHVYMSVCMFVCTAAIDKTKAKKDC